MNSQLWILVRIVGIIGFGFGAGSMFAKQPGLEFPPAFAEFAICFFFFWSALKTFTKLCRRFGRKFGRDDWTASLWTSPYLKNPESNYLTIGLAFSVANVVDAIILASQGRSLLNSFMFSIGWGILAGLTAFRVIRLKKTNQAQGPTT